MGSNPGMVLHHGGPFGLSYNCNKELFKQASTTVGNTLNAIYYKCVNERKKISKSGRGRTYILVFTSPLLYHLHQQNI
jgi:hypothetical protein